MLRGMSSIELRTLFSLVNTLLGIRKTIGRVSKDDVIEVTLYGYVDNTWPSNCRPDWRTHSREGKLEQTAIAGSSRNQEIREHAAFSLNLNALNTDKISSKNERSETGLLSFKFFIRDTIVRTPWKLQMPMLGTTTPCFHTVAYCS